MGLFTADELRFAQLCRDVIYCNPLLPRRIELERAALGDDFDERNARWNAAGGNGRRAPTVALLADRAAQVLDDVRRRRAANPGETLADDDLALYEDVASLVIFGRQGAIEIRAGDTAKPPGEVYDSLLAEAKRHMALAGARLSLIDSLPHLFACYHQARRAFVNIYNFIVGVSEPTIRLRAAIWESIFTHDMRRYRRVLHARMADYTTLVIGPSGSGKELVAKAIGQSRYIPYDPVARSFAGGADSFFPLNLSALSPTLIESELFGHKRGSFTGAVADRAGWLEECPELGTVFLDEIGELDVAVQIKLLRVLQNRTFSRLGESDTRHFHGKIIAATNRNLAEKMQAGEFREDFYYRLCSDIIATPSLAERLADNPAELRQLIRHVVRHAVGEDADDVTNEVELWINDNLGPDYPWPGNVRELEQCVRNVLIRQHYQPACRQGASNAASSDAFIDGVLRGRFTVDDLLRHYCTLVYAQTGSYEATARRLNLDRRTVRTKIDPQLLAQYTRGAQPNPSVGRTTEEPTV